MDCFSCFVILQDILNSGSVFAVNLQDKASGFRLIKAKRMKPIGLSAVSHAFDKNQKLVIKPDILRAIKANKEAWKNFQKFPEGYRRVRIGFIEGARKHGKKFFQKSLNYFIGMTEKNMKFGMVK